MDDTARQPGIQLRGVGVRRGDRWILRDINWTVQAGSSCAILGPNGSGKSTLARILCGYIWPTVGEVIIDGHRFGETDLNELRHSIRLVQPAGPYDVDPELTAHQVVLTGLYGTIGLFDQPKDREIASADHLISRVGLSLVADHRYSTLSSGERMRALIARALIRKTRLLLLDEPTNGLDLLAREQVLATVQALSAEALNPPTTVLVTHHVEELGPAVSEVLLLDEGRVAAAGRIEQVLQSEVLSRVYRCPLTTHVEAGRYYVRVDPSIWRNILE